MEERIKNFARLAVELGVNIKKGDDLVINSPLEDPTLAEYITQYAYEAGARLVTINREDDKISRLKYMYESQETLNEVADYVIEKKSYQLEKHRSKQISIVADDPDLLKGLDSEKISQALQKRASALKEFVPYYMNDNLSRLVISYPTKNRAMKVFPELDEACAINKLREKILDTCRVSTSREETKNNRERHIKDLDRRAGFLNEEQFDKLHYSSKNGTDLRVKLPKNHIRLSASSTNEDGDRFIPNMPTEEVFTSPEKFGVNGRLVAVKPLVYNGFVINNFEFTFKDGKVVDFKAKEGYDTLRQMLKADQNSAYLGEIALVPYKSPISLSGLLFYNTLFDENASCHFALGKAYPTTVKGAKDLPVEKLESVGLNDSLIHEDFMVGAEDLNIRGFKDGLESQIFKDGNRA